jgi:hypothetical protein
LDATRSKLLVIEETSARLAIKSALKPRGEWDYTLALPTRTPTTAPDAPDAPDTAPSPRTAPKEPPAEKLAELLPLLGHWDDAGDTMILTLAARRLRGPLHLPLARASSTLDAPRRARAQAGPKDKIYMQIHDATTVTIKLAQKRAPAVTSCNQYFAYDPTGHFDVHDSFETCKASPRLVLPRPLLPEYYNEHVTGYLGGRYTTSKFKAMHDLEYACDSNIGYAMSGASLKARAAWTAAAARRAHAAVAAAAAPLTAVPSMPQLHVVPPVSMCKESAPPLSPDSLSGTQPQISSPSPGRSHLGDEFAAAADGGGAGEGEPGKEGGADEGTPRADEPTEGVETGHD